MEIIKFTPTVVLSYSEEGTYTLTRPLFKTTVGLLSGEGVHALNEINRLYGGDKYQFTLQLNEHRQVLIIGMSADGDFIGIWFLEPDGKNPRIISQRLTTAYHPENKSSSEIGYASLDYWIVRNRRSGAHHLVRWRETPNGMRYEQVSQGLWDWFDTLIHIEVKDGFMVIIPLSKAGSIMLIDLSTDEIILRLHEVIGAPIANLSVMNICPSCEGVRLSLNNPRHATAGIADRQYLLRLVNGRIYLTFIEGESSD